MSNEIKQSSPIGDVEQEIADDAQYKKISKYVTEQSVGMAIGEKYPYTDVCDLIFNYLKIAGSQWASPGRDELLETVKIALAYRDFGVLNEYLSKIGENKIPAPAHPTAEFCEGEDDIAFDFHKANEHPTAVNGDDAEHRERLRILELHLGSEYYRTGEFHNNISNAMKEYAQPKAAAPKADEWPSPRSGVTIDVYNDPPLNINTVKKVVADMLEKGLITSEYHKRVLFDFIKFQPKAAAPKADVKSKEEILEKHSTKLSSGQYVFSAKGILEAMEEYANQFKPREITNYNDVE